MIVIDVKGMPLRNTLTAGENVFLKAEVVVLGVGWFRKWQTTDMLYCPSTMRKTVRPEMKKKI